jgi:hypothetical protein
MSVAVPMRVAPWPWWEIPAVCPGCGCTADDACVVLAGPIGELVQVGCRWVEVDDGWRCSGCVWPEDKVRGPVVDHRAAPVGTGADAAAPAGGGEE